MKCVKTTTTKPKKTSVTHKVLEKLKTFCNYALSWHPKLFGKSFRHFMLFGFYWWLLGGLAVVVFRQFRLLGFYLCFFCFGCEHFGLMIVYRSVEFECLYFFLMSWCVFISRYFWNYMHLISCTEVVHPFAVFCFALDFCECCFLFFSRAPIEHACVFFIVWLSCVWSPAGRLRDQ